MPMERHKPLSFGILSERVGFSNDEHPLAILI